MSRPIKSMLVSAMTALLGFCNAGSASAQGFVNTAPAERFVDFDIHLSAGGSGITQNYASKFEQIRELTNSMGAQYGVGASAVFSFNSFVGFGTELNLLLNHARVNMMVASGQSSTVSSIFLRNRSVYANIPVFMRFRFSISDAVKWDVMGGVYYSYGISGKQKQSIYNASLNSLDQLVPQMVMSEPDFFNCSSTFINSFRRSDYGLHLGTGIRFGKHISVGFICQLGLKNISFTSGLVNPSIHNYSVSGRIGYVF